jgi:hypothetical protein
MVFVFVNVELEPEPEVLVNVVGVLVSIPLSDPIPPLSD